MYPSHATGGGEFGPLQRLRWLGQALDDLGQSFAAQRSQGSQTPGSAMLTVTAVATVFNHYQTQLAQLLPLTTLVLRETVAREGATGAEIEDLAARLAPMLESLLLLEPTLSSPATDPEVAAGRDLMQAVCRHSLDQLQHWLDSAAAQLADPEASLQRLGLPTLAAADLPLRPALTWAPEAALLAAWALRHGIALVAPAATGAVLPHRFFPAGGLILGLGLGVGFGSDLGGPGAGF